MAMVFLIKKLKLGFQNGLQNNLVKIIWTPDALEDVDATGEFIARDSNLISCKHSIVGVLLHHVCKRNSN